MKKIYTTSIANYEKALKRFSKSVHTGRFAKFTRHKRWQLWNRLCRYARQLGITVKAPVAAASLLAGLAINTSASAQSYVEKTGAANPLNFTFVGASMPTFVDIDNDGDMDAFIGLVDGSVSYYKNTGTNRAPVFAVQTGAANPLTIDVGNYAVPTFVDIDNDGDMDAFVGTAYNGVYFYRNTGTRTVPVFIQVTGAANPLGSFNSGFRCKPVFLDIDNDGDTDAFVGTTEDYYSHSSVLYYYKNTGTSTAPVLTQQASTANPLNGVTKDIFDMQAFADVDGDGDKDFFLGAADGNIYYYKNTGNRTSPVFVEQTTANNPLSGSTGQGYPSPTFVDVDADGDLDAFIGNNNGTIRYYVNNAITLPLQLTSFTGKSVSGDNQLNWQTAGEIGTREFQVERSGDGFNFAPIVTVAAAGAGASSYSATDHQPPSGKLFYRLRMVDLDGKFTYSQVIGLGEEQSASISIYPNPAVSTISINIGSSALQHTEAQLYDAAGKLQQSFRVTNTRQQVNVSSLSPGLYLIKFADGTVESFIKK